MTKKILTIGDLHLSDNNYGKHKDYKGHCLSVMGNIKKAISDTNETYEQIVLLGDLADKRFIDLKFRIAVDNFLEFLKSKCNHLYCLKGNHDFVEGLTTELDYYTAKGVIDQHPVEETVNDIKISYVDFERNKDVCVANHTVDSTVILTHNSCANNDTSIIESVDVSQLVAPNLKLVVMGHIHEELYFTANGKFNTVKIFNGGSACVKNKDEADRTEFNMLCLEITDDSKLGVKKITVPLPTDLFVDTEPTVEKEQVENIEINFDITNGTTKGVLEIDTFLEYLEKKEIDTDVVDTIKGLFVRGSGVDESELTTGTMLVSNEIEIEDFSSDLVFDDSDDSDNCDEPDFDNLFTSNLPVFKPNDEDD